MNQLPSSNRGWKPPSLFGKTKPNDSGAARFVDADPVGFELRTIGEDGTSQKPTTPTPPLYGDKRSPPFPLSSSAADGRYSSPNGLVSRIVGDKRTRFALVSVLALCAVAATVAATRSWSSSSSSSVGGSGGVDRDTEGDGMTEVSFGEIQHAFHTLAQSMMKMNFTLNGSELK